jgi:hypothetical protein
MPSITTKLKPLLKKSVEKGHWQVVATATALMSDEESLDARINLVGSLHEVGLLSNSLEPYWSAWRSSAEDELMWIGRCLDRLASADADYWALAGLLGVGLQPLRECLATRRYKLLNVRFAESHKDGRWQIGTFCLNYNPEISRTILPVLELGWSEGALCEAGRWRAVILDEQRQLPDGLVGRGSGSYFMRAKLPYGCWRVHHDTLEFKDEWLIPLRDTPFADYQ